MAGPMAFCPSGALGSARSPSGRNVTDPRPAFVRADLQMVRAVYHDDREIARTLGVEFDQLSSWERGTLPGKELEERIHQFADAVRWLCTFYDPSIVPGWFRADAGRGRRDEMLQRGEYLDLHAEIGDAEQGAYL
jgi:transcriptional regulator with XRE-family HTH domain